MSKTEDIPQDVIEATTALTPCYGADRYCRHESDQSCEDGCEWFDSIARAIMAERERCGGITAAAAKDADNAFRGLSALNAAAYMHGRAQSVVKAIRGDA